MHTPSNPGDSLSRRRKLLYILMLGALTALGPFTVDLYLPAFPALEASLGVTEAAVQLTLTGTTVDAQSAPSCVLEVSMQGAPPALELGTLRLDLLFPDGRTEQPGLLAVDGQRALLDAVLVDSALGRSALKDAVALRITDGRQARFIRLR